MRRIVVTVLAVVVLGVFAGMYSSVSAAVSKSFSVGGGEQVAGGITKHFAFSAHNGPNGPSGHAVFTQDDPTLAFGDFTLSGHVACVSVVGNDATIGVAIEQATGTAVGQQGIFIVVSDHGNGSSAAPDTLTNSGYVSAADLAVCPPPFEAGTPVTSGNINVKP
jgi:hypothetical protein